MVLHNLLSEDDLRKLKEVRDMLEDLIETIDLLTDEEAMKKLMEAIEDIKKGNITKWEDVKED